MFLLKIILPFVILLFSTSGFSQVWQYYASGDRVWDIATDEDTIWVGNEGGLTKLVNGTPTFYHPVNSPIKYSNVTTVTIDNQGHKWITAAGSQVLEFDGNTWTDHTGGTANYQDTDFDQNNNTLWAAFASGLLKYKNGVWTRYEGVDFPFLPNNGCLSVKVDAAGVVWLGTSNGLVRFDGVNWYEYNTSNSNIGGNTISNIAIDASNNKWLTSSVGIIKFDGTTWTKYNSGNSGLPDQFSNVSVFGNFVYTQSGNKIYKFENGSWTMIDCGPPPIALPLEFQHYSLTVDKYGHVWFAHIAGYLCKYDGISVSYYHAANSLLPHYTQGDIAIDKNGDVWFSGEQNGGNTSIAKFDGSTWIRHSILSGLDPLPNSSLAVDQSNNLWITKVGSGLAEYNGSNFTYYKTNNSAIPSNYARVVKIDMNNVKWVGTIQGIASFDGTNWVTYNTSNSGLADNFVTEMAIDSLGNIWATGHYVLSKFDGTSWTTYDFFPDLIINTITVDKYNNLWLGTNEGLIKFKDGVLEKYSSTGVRDILIDQNENMWLGTARGLVKFDGTMFYGFQIKQSYVEYSDVAELAMDPAGNLWVGDGVVYYLPNALSALPDFQLPTVTTTGITPINPYSSNVSGEIISDGGDPILERGICWSTSPHPEKMIPATRTIASLGQLGTFTSTLLSNPSETYYVRTYATNRAGTAYGNEITFTSPSPVLATLTTDPVTSITENSAVSGGEITDDGGKPVLARGICWSTSPNPVVGVSTTNDGTGIGSFVSAISDLNPNVTYYVRAYAYNEDGACYGNQEIFTTPMGTGINSASSNHCISLYPNPSSGEFKIEVKQINQRVDNAEIKIIDNKGVLVHNQRIFFIGGNYESEIDLKGIPNGIYTLQVKSDEAVSTYKIIIE